jgi:hypothetical protein
MSKTSAETAAAIAAFKGEVKKCPDGTARGADGKMSASELAVREYIARHQTKVKPHNGGRSYRQRGMVPCQQFTDKAFRL